MAGADPVIELDARFSGPGAVVTAWEDVRRTMDDAQLFWISTVRADGRPHVTPLLAVWQEGALHFCTGAIGKRASIWQETDTAFSRTAATRGRRDSTL